MKKVLLVGGGGREHAIAWKLRQSKNPIELYVAPGNAGTESLAVNASLKATDIDGLENFAPKMGINFTIVGQDDPLAMGIVDRFQEKELDIFGPDSRAARIEASKVFSKELMLANSVPTAAGAAYDQYDLALLTVRSHFNSIAREYPIVIKADGLALGKGVRVCKTLTEAKQALDEILVKKVHGNAGDKIVIEQFVDGQEISLHAFSDGKTFKMFPSAQDHKPIFDGDLGPNTGGMGTIAPVPWFTGMDVAAQKVVAPILAGMRNAGHPFVGLLYPGIKLLEDWQDRPMVLEFNARFGDPETQSYMRLLKTDLLEIFEACVDGRLHEINIEWHPGFAACVVLASEGYPSSNYKKGVPITGIEEAEKIPGVVVFHAGTKLVDGQIVTSGGRVLGVTAVGATLQEALDTAYKGVAQIHFDGMQYRKDIGQKSLALVK